MIHNIARNIRYMRLGSVMPLPLATSVKYPPPPPRKLYNYYIGAHPRRSVNFDTCIQQILKDLGWDTSSPGTGGIVHARGSFRRQCDGLPTEAIDRKAPENLWVHLMVWTGLYEREPLTRMHGIEVNK